MFRLLVLVLVLVGAAAMVWSGGLGRVAGVARPAPASTSTSVQRAPGEQSVQITESDLDQVLTEHMVGQQLGSTPLGAATLTHISTHLEDGHLQADGDAAVASASVPVSMTASSSARDGRAIVNVEDLRAAGLPLPSSARDSVEQALQAEVDQEVARLSLRVTSVTIDGGKLTLTGTRP